MFALRSPKVFHMSAANSRGARLAVDIGGTFTDIVLDACGKQWTGKVLTTPRAPEEAVVEAIGGEVVTDVVADAPIVDAVTVDVQPDLAVAIRTS